MIESFGNRLAEDLFDDRRSKAVLRFAPELIRAARRKLLYLHDASGLEDLRQPPGNRLEALRGEWKGFHSIRINDQWGVVFRWDAGSVMTQVMRDVRRAKELAWRQQSPSWFSPSPEPHVD